MSFSVASSYSVDPAEVWGGIVVKNLTSYCWALQGAAVTPSAFWTGPTSSPHTIILLKPCWKHLNAVD
jgi:hypothetical protein